MTPRGRARWLPSALLLLQVPGCLSLSGPRSVTGIVGGSLSVECRYQEALVDNIKYWCKHPCVSPWKIVETRESEREVRRGRVSIRDRPASLTFTVTLKSLREEDAGTYGCGIYVPFSVDPTFQVAVSVIPGCLSLSGPSRVTGIVGGSLSVECRYREEFKQNIKFWCKVPCLWNTVETGGSSREVREGRVSIRDHPASLTFTVTLESLREEDAGTYGCGIDMPLSFDPTFQVEVSVTPGCLSIRGPESVRGQERESVSVKCRYDSKWESHKKWWCRGAWWASCRILVQTQGSGREENGDRVSIRDDQRNRSFTVTLQELRQDDADTYWCGIERPGTDLGAQIKVTVGPKRGETRGTAAREEAPWTRGRGSPERAKCGGALRGEQAPRVCADDLGRLRLCVGEAALTVLGSQASRTRSTSRPAASSRPHSRTHYMLLAFLKVPFLLGLVGAVLWLEERRRDVSEPQGQPIYANLSSELLTRDTRV
ncbi:hypothetical protein G4228_002965 [Cervus hanglu yarkandensis]|nr:hypothetical protein G4228_002965 [Cervus hanglu yarkandensis]